MMLESLNFLNFYAILHHCFKACNIMPLKLINDLQLSCFMYRCNDNIMPFNLCKIFAENSKFHSQDTRIKNKLHQDSDKLTLRSNTVRIARVLLWNSFVRGINQCFYIFPFTNNLQTVSYNLFRNSYIYISKVILFGLYLGVPNSISF